MLWDSITDDWISRFVSSKDAAVHYLRGKKRGGRKRMRDNGMAWQFFNREIGKFPLKAGYSFLK